MKKPYKSSGINNHKITKQILFYGVPLKGYVASKLFLNLAPEIKKSVVGISSD